MEATTFQQPTDGEKAAEAGMSPTAFSLEKNGKGNSSAATRARFDVVMAKYGRADETAKLAQRQLENAAAVGRRVVGAA